MLDSPLFWTAFSLLFIAPFFDPRRPGRVLHLDLAAITMLAAFGSGVDRAGGWVLVQWLPLAYLALRLTFIGLRGPSEDGAVVPLVRPNALLVAALALVAARIVFNLAQNYVIASGAAGPSGAIAILQGHSPYGLSGAGHLDTYGPANYLVYLPFQWAAGGATAGLDAAAHAVAVLSDLGVFVALVAIARRIEHRQAGAATAAVAWGWAASPFAWNASYFSTNDLLVAVVMTLPFLALARPWARGALVALAAGVKFVALPLAPGFARARQRSDSWQFTLAFAVVLAALFVPFVANDARVFYERTIGFQLSFRELRPPAVALLLKSLAALAAAVFFLAPRRNPVQLAALAGAAVIALQIAIPFWWLLYIVWWLPLALLALLAGKPVELES